MIEDQNEMDVDTNPPKQPTEQDVKETQAVQVMWDYLHMGQDVSPFKQTPATVLLCLGSSDIRVAQHAAQLFNKGVAEWLCFSGGIGTGPHSGKNLLGWESSEASVFAAEAIKCGVSKDRILIESESRNTGENIRLSHQLFTQRNINVKSLIVTTKPYMERRAYATFMKQWPGTEIPQMVVTSPSIPCAIYPEGTGVDRKDIIGIMAGDLQRIKLYAQPPTEFQIKQDIPEDVWKAFEFIAAAGYTNNLVK